MREIKFRAWDKQENTWLEAVTYTLHTSGRLLTQFTGLRDKNGKEVYEGDIVKGTTNMYEELRERTEQVAYDEDMLLMPFHEIWDYDANLWMHCLIDGFEVIGNIYENPDLLTKL